MTWRNAIIAFWVFIAVMLAWQAYNYNNSIVSYSQAHPEQHYFYSPGASPSPVPVISKADVRQTSYKVISNSPAQGSFTIDFTVKNVGNVAATAIQVKVRPYRGISNADTDNGNPHPDTSQFPGSDPNGVSTISDTDITSQFGEWVDVPDLAPGQEYNTSIIFTDRPGINPNSDNPKLEITFQPVKSK